MPHRAEKRRDERGRIRGKRTCRRDRGNLRICPARHPRTARNKERGVRGGDPPRKGALRRGLRGALHGRDRSRLRRGKSVLFRKSRPLFRRGERLRRIPFFGKISRRQVSRPRRNAVSRAGNAGKKANKRARPQLRARLFIKKIIAVCRCFSGVGGGIRG